MSRRDWMRTEDETPERYRHCIGWDACGEDHVPDVGIFRRTDDNAWESWDTDGLWVPAAAPSHWYYIERPTP